MGPLLLWSHLTLTYLLVLFENVREPGNQGTVEGIDFNEHDAVPEHVHDKQCGEDVTPGWKHLAPRLFRFLTERTGCKLLIAIFLLS